MRSYVLLKIEKIHFLIFGHEMSEDMKLFLKNISWSFSGGIIASAILLITNILAGRLLGPTEYGKYNIIWAISQILLVFMLFGMDTASVRFISQEKSGNEKKKQISSSFYLAICASTISSLLYLLFIKHLERLLGINHTLLIWALILGLILSFRQLFDCFLRSLRLFKYQSLARISESIIIVFIFWILFNYSSNKNYSAYIGSLIIGGVMLIAFYYIKLDKLFSYLNRDALRKQASYAKFVFIAGTIGILFGSLDKIIIGKYLSLQELGIYGAYYTSSFALASQLSLLFTNVFFPHVSQTADHLPAILKKIDRLSIIGTIPMLLIMFLIVTAIMKLFGKNYELNWYYVISFSFLAVLQIMVSINSSIILSHSKKALQRSTILGITINIVIMVLYGLLISFNQLSIQSVVITLVIYYAITLLACKCVQFSIGLYAKK